MPMRFPKFLDIQYSNDIVLSDKILILGKINSNATLSFSFLVLLISSSIICTLGLLLNSAPIVIGGMIISPLMWPLTKTAVGISNEDSTYIRHAVALLILAIIITFVSSSIITYISPIKTLTAEILALTEPTLLDLIIALVVGSVAALAITQPKISESLAGVAIATSLMPPLCVSGIGLALFDYQTFLGGLLLFLANAVAIIFVAVIIFYFIGIKRETNTKLRRESAYILIGMIILLSIPLYFYLKTYTFKAEAYQKTQAILQQNLQEISPLITVTNISTDLSSADNGALAINAQILLPQNLSIDYAEQSKIVTDLENALHKKVDLNLNIQQTISIVSAQDIQDTETKRTLQQTFINVLRAINPDVSIDTLEITKQNNSWTAAATLHSDPSVLFTQADRRILEDALIKTIGAKVSVNLVLTPQIQLQSNESAENRKIVQEVQDSLATFINPSSISSVRIASPDTKTSTQSATILVDLATPKGFTLPDSNFTNLKNQLQTEYKKQFILQVNVVNQESTQY